MPSFNPPNPTCQIHFDHILKHVMPSPQESWKWTTRSFEGFMPSTSMIGSSSSPLTFMTRPACSVVPVSCPHWVNCHSVDVSLIAINNLLYMLYKAVSRQNSVVLLGRLEDLVDPDCGPMSNPMRTFIQAAGSSEVSHLSLRTTWRHTKKPRDLCLPGMLRSATITELVSKSFFSYDVR